MGLARRDSSVDLIPWQSQQVGGRRSVKEWRKDNEPKGMSCVFGDASSSVSLLQSRITPVHRRGEFSFRMRMPARRFDKLKWTCEDHARVLAVRKCSEPTVR